MPSISTNDWRATLCGWLAASRHRDDRRDAGVGGIEDLGPLVAGPGPEGRREGLTQLRPAGPVVLRRQSGRVQAEPVEQRGVELRLDGADGHVPTVGRLVHVVVRRAGVEHVGAALVAPQRPSTGSHGASSSAARRRRPSRRRRPGHGRTRCARAAPPAPRRRRTSRRRRSHRRGSAAGSVAHRARPTCASTPAIEM